MGLKEINKLGGEINSVKERCNIDTELLLKDIPETIAVIKSKKRGIEFIYLNTYRQNINVFREVIKRKDMAWGEMIKLLEGFAIKEQGKKVVKKRVKKK